jgi:hypothetical protein
MNPSEILLSIEPDFPMKAIRGFNVASAGNIYIITRSGGEIFLTDLDGKFKLCYRHYDNNIFHYSRNSNNGLLEFLAKRTKLFVNAYISCIEDIELLKEYQDYFYGGYVFYVDSNNIESAKVYISQWANCAIF